MFLSFLIVYKKRDKYYDEVEIALTNVLGRKVKVYLSSTGNKGTLEFEFFGKEDLSKLTVAVPL